MSVAMSFDEDFQERLDRIQTRREGRKNGMGFVVHPDGVVTAIGRPKSRLRFGFPLKGLLLALVIAVAVKAYLMWVLGADVYGLEVQNLLQGSGPERLAGKILQSDALTMWVVERYNDIYAFVQGGLSASLSE